MGHAVGLGRDPRTITEDIVRHLRNAFLSLMAPELVVLPSDRVDAIAAQAQQLGAAALVRAIERLGSALVDMRHAPDPRILVEVALVQLTHDQAGGDTDALLARIERLEGTVKQLREAGAAAAAVPKDPSTGRAVLGGAAQRPTPAPAAQATESDAAPSVEVPSGGPPESNAPQPAAPSTPTPATLSVPDAWEQTVKSEVKPLVRALYSAGSFVGNRGDAWQFSVPNEAHGSKCNEHRSEVEAALARAVGAPVTIEFVSGGAPVGESGDDVASTRGAAPSRPSPAPAPAAAAAAAAGSAPVTADAPPAAPARPEPEHQPEPEPEPYVPEADEDVDLHELTDAPPESVKTPIDRLAEAFPGSELMADD
jgi:DNA polymerase-3 subunit gamma/tau